MHTKASEAEIKNINGRSVLIGLKNEKPLKLLSPKTHTRVCHLVTTNYGGGMVSGDTVTLNIRCLEQTTTLLSSQANSRIYKSHNDSEPCKYEQNTFIDNNSLFIQLNDPLVLQKDSSFEQELNYELKNSSVLLLADWVEVGRVHMGEVFTFNKFYSECKIHIDSKPVVIDRFLIEPNRIDCSSPAVFYNHTSFINIYVVGHEDSKMVMLLENALNHESDTLAKNLSMQQPAILASADRINCNVFMVRISAIELKELWHFIHEFAKVLKENQLLEFNPYERKY